MQVTQRIESEDFAALIPSDEFLEFNEYMLCTNEDGDPILDSDVPKLSTWLDAIDKDAKTFVASSDDGNRDNILENHAYAKHFLRLCKLLPLWSAVSCQFFDSPYRTGTSWQSETWFKNLKQMHGEEIPCSLDDFVQRDLRLTNASVVLASRRYAGPKKSKMAETQEAESNEVNAFNEEMVDIPNELHKSNSTNATENSESDHQGENEQSSTTECAACTNGHKPIEGQGHSCVSCSKPIHALPGCSVDIGEEEGHGQRRLCMSCHASRNTEQRKVTSNASEKSTSQTAKEMNYVDIWKKKTGIKRSKYMKPVPNWSLIDIQKKVKIGHLINANRSSTTHRINGIVVNLQNTCAPDSLIQLLAACYAYNKSFKAFVDVHAKGDIFGIVKMLAMK